MNDLFDPVSGTWHRVSPRLATLRRLLLTTASVVVTVACVVGLVLLDAATVWVVVVVVAGAVAAVCGWAWALRNQRAWGYAEDDDDLVVTRGVLFKRLVAVPYGRMQFVDVHAGPLDRLFGIATVTLHTASTKTAADIPGLRSAEATRLRNRLTELGESHGAGL